MNYYFMKDKAGDETDEFYDDEALRRERAERYRKHLAFESPMNLLKGDLIVSFLYIIVLCLLTYLNKESLFLMWFFIIFSTIEFACILGSMITGERLYRDFSLTREEWNLRKKNSVRKHFHRVQELRSFLQTQSEYGLSLSGYDNGRYLFEEDSCRYNYFVDTKACMKKRLKEQGVHYKDDPKNISAWDLKWYEMSMENAAQYGLKPVAVVQKHVLIYKRPYSDDALPWENGNARISLWQAPTLFGLLLFIGCFLLGVIMGFLSSPFS